VSRTGELLLADFVYALAVRYSNEDVGQVTRKIDRVTETAKAYLASLEAAPPAPHESQNRYRIGRKVGRTIYEGDELIGIMDTTVKAGVVVDALNRCHGWYGTPDYA
jgi:hypothetical protein